MILSGHQPSYVPWLGFFEKLMNCDVFVYHDTAQFEKSGFLHRNRIKNANGPIWLTVPVQTAGYMHRPLNSIAIHQDTHWRKTHLKSIQISYARSRFFERYYPFFQQFYSIEWTNLVEMNVYFVEFVIKELELSTQVEFVSKHPEIAGYKSDFILSMCKHFNADCCYTGINGMSYMNTSDFKKAGISVEFQDFHYPVYDQLFGEFIPNLSIIDVLFNCGPELTRQIISEGRGVVHS